MTTPASPPSATATILCTDLVGSTEMRTRLGDAAADQVLRDHDELLGRVVGRHNGAVVKGLGDGILAAFGATADAVRAAHEMQVDVDRANRRAPVDRRVEVRVGLSAGDVSWDQGDCHGTPVVSAARLCAEADGGQVLCDDLVRGLARGHTELRFVLVGELELKGLPEPVTAYEIPWAAASLATAVELPAPLRRHPGDLPFAGRDAERRQLIEAWKHAQVDGATVVLLSGEPGIGKTRLAAEIAREAHDNGGLVVLGRCDEHVAAPHAPWIEALRLLVAAVPEGVVTDHVARHGGELARLVPDLARRHPDLPPPTVADPDTERFLLFDAAVDLIATASTVQPVVVVIDDAHWADAGSVHLLRHVVTHLDPGAHVLVIITYRDTDVDRTHALVGALADLHRAASAERISLRGFDETAMRAFLEAAGGTPLEVEGVALAQRLTAETDGNPFFVTEVLRHLVDTGALVQRDGVWVGTVEPGSAGLPEGVRDVIGQRLSRLPPETNELLRAAAVVGREFDVDLVAAVAKTDLDAAIDLLDATVGARLVHEVPDHIGRLGFAHALVRQTLLEELSTNKRVRLHRRIAELLDERGSAPIDVLAHHYCEAAVAGVAARAVECAAEAAANAVQRFAWEDAIRLYERGLEAVDALDHDDPGLRAELLSAMALPYQGSGRAARGRECALQAARLARASGDAARLTAAGVAYQGQLGMWAEPGDPVAVELIREGLAALGDDRPDVRARAGAALAHALLLAPGSQALDVVDRAIVAAREAGDDVSLRHALQVRAWAVRGNLAVAERLRAAEDAVAAAAAAGDRYLELAARYHLGTAQLNGGELDAARETFSTSAEYRGALEGWAIADFETAMAIAQGRFAEAPELAKRAHRLGAALGDTNDGVYAVQRVTIALAIGDASVHDALEELRSTAVGGKTPMDALVLLLDGDEPGARATFGAWLHESWPMTSSLMRYSYLHSASLAASRLGPLDGQEPLDELRAYAERFAGELLGTDVVIPGAADAARGRLAALTGDLDRAVSLLEAGHALHEDLGLHACAVDSGHDLGVALLRRGDRDDHEHGRTLLAATVDLAERLGMAPAARAARAAAGR